MDFNDKRELGRTGLMAGRLGIASSFGAPASSYEEAFEKGCNYFTWGTFIKGRSGKMEEAVKNIRKKGRRENLILSMWAYSHTNFLTERALAKGLNKLGIDYTDILLLGYFSKRPPQRLIDGALKLKEKGLARFIGISSHNRKVFAPLAEEGLFDVFHIRYNAANKGAEEDTFPFIAGEGKPGIVAFTATRWRQLLSEKKMPDGEGPLTASECYRFALSHASVDVCMMGAKTGEQLRENLKVLDEGPLSEAEMERVRKIGAYVYSH